MKLYFLSIMKGIRKGFRSFLIILLLWPFTFFYRFGLFFHRGWMRFRGVYKAPKPVISIGNITVGGTGKTPLVIWITRHLQDKGFKSIILIRGYMPQANKRSDEVAMLFEQLPYVPVLEGADRVANIKKAQERLPTDVYIADDAFQYWPLKRDLDIVAIDANNPFGNGHLLPAGILREPLSALKRADVFILTKIDLCRDVQALTNRLKKINPKALIMESRYQSEGCIDAFESISLPASLLKGQDVVGFTGIGDPMSFEASLNNSGARIVRFFNFVDHYSYQHDDLAPIVNFCRAQKIGVIVTTHKDTVKLQAFKTLFAGIKLVYLPIQVEITKGSDEFFKRVISVCLR